MANSPRFNSACNTAMITDLGAIGTLLNSGFLEIWSGAQPALDGSPTGTKLAKLTFGATAFGTATDVAGVITMTANAITSDTAAVAGTAASFVLVKSDDTTYVASGSVGTSGADLNLNSLTIAGGATVACSSFTITAPRS
jgi:hypothetical protein